MESQSEGPKLKPTAKKEIEKMPEVVIDIKDKEKGSAEKYCLGEQEHGLDFVQVVLPEGRAGGSGGRGVPMHIAVTASEEAVAGGMLAASVGEGAVLKMHARFYFANAHATPQMCDCSYI